MRARPSKLRDGSWGIRIEGPDAVTAAAGVPVEVHDVSGGRVRQGAIVAVAWRGKTEAGVPAVVCTVTYDAPTEAPTVQTDTTPAALAVQIANLTAAVADLTAAVKVLSVNVREPTPTVRRRKGGAA